MHKFKVGDIIAQDLRLKSDDIYLVIKSPDDVGELYEIFSMTQGFITYHYPSWLEVYYRNA